MKREELEELQKKTSKGNALIKEIDKLKLQIESLKHVNGVQLLFDKSKYSGNWSTSSTDIVGETLELVRNKLTNKLNKLEKELDEL